MGSCSAGRVARRQFVSKNVGLAHGPPTYLHHASFSFAQTTAPAAHGSIVRSRILGRDVIDALKFTVPIASAHQIIYATYDPINKRDYTTPATVLIPASRGLYGLTGSNPILMYALAYDSASAKCGPSYQTSDKTFTSAEGILAQEALLAGMIVVWPDYEGPMGAFNVGPIAGNSLLDATRAVLSFKPAVPDKNRAKVVLKGYSGGSVPVSWAVQQQPKYAPELLPWIKGASMGGMPTMPSSSLKALNGGQYSTLVLSALAAYSNVFKSLSDWVAKRLTPEGKTVMDDVQKLCAADNLTAYPDTDVFEKYMGISEATAMADPTVAPILASLVLAGSNDVPVPQIPLYVYSSKEDDTLPHAETERYVTALCNRKVGSLEYNVVPTGGHVQTELLVGPTAAFTFLNARLAGILPPAKGCNATLFEPPANSHSSRALIDLAAASL